ncbi:MAG: F0F1 ATP synthase subunit alpha, partial [Candidatus Puniceispirillales bacterium]
VEEQVVSIFAGVNGYLDGIALSDVGRFEDGLLTHMRGAGAAILKTIREEKAVSDDTKEKLVAELDGYAKSFA